MNNSSTISKANTQKQRPSTPSETAGDVDDLAAVVSQVSRTFKRYARERPDVVALWCLGIGFVVGWRVKPW